MTIMVVSRCGAPNLILRIRLEWLFKVGYINVCIWWVPPSHDWVFGEFLPQRLLLGNISSLALQYGREIVFGNVDKTHYL